MLQRESKTSWKKWKKKKFQFPKSAERKKSLSTLISHPSQLWSLSGPKDITLSIIPKLRPCSNVRLVPSLVHPLCVAWRPFARISFVRRACLSPYRVRVADPTHLTNCRTIPPLPCKLLVSTLSLSLYMSLCCPGCVPWVKCNYPLFLTIRWPFAAKPSSSSRTSSTHGL